MARRRKRPEKPSNHGTPKEVTFEYLKSGFFRVIHADGAWGGLSPHGQIVMAFWNERPPIPKEMVFRVTPDGLLGDEVKEQRKCRKGIVREVEVSVVMNLAIAKECLAWLKERVEMLEQHLATSEQKREQ